MLAYLNDQYLPQDEIVISPDDRGFLFADGLYEVIRSYQGRLFQVQAHVDRLNYGARSLRLKVTDFGYLIEVAQELIRRNELDREDAIIYIQVTRGAAPRLHRFPPEDTPLTVYAVAMPFERRKKDQEEGVSVIFVPDQRWARCDIKSVGLLPNVLANQRARDFGAYEAVFVRDGFVMEGTHTSVFAVIDGEVLTPPRTNYILGGITRLVVLDLCEKLSIPYRERSISEPEAHRADELMVIGTTTEITPVVQVNGEKLGSGQPGPLTRRLQEAFFDRIS